MIYLVTGGAGFIGSHLVDQLIQLGHNVIIVDNLSTGKLENINPLAQFIEGDVRDTALVTQLIEKVDACFHLAAIASVELSKMQWYITNQVNLGATINIFEQAAKKRINVVYASSAAIYGDNDHLPLSELAIPKPITAYGVDKLSCEFHAKIAGLIHQTPTIGLRFFNVYGPRQDPHSPYSGVISKFMENIKHKKDITIYGDGEQSRDFIYVTDIVKHLITAMDKASCSSDVLNVCTGRVTTINELAHIMMQAVGKKVKVNYTAARLGDIKHSLGDPTEAIKKLNITADVLIQEGINKLLAVEVK